MYCACIFPAMLCDVLMHFGDLSMRAVHQYAIIHRCRNSWVFYLMASVFKFSLFLVYHSINGRFMLFGQMIAFYGRFMLFGQMIAIYGRFILFTQMSPFTPGFAG